MGNNTNILISIIMPVYNSGVYLESAIRSILYHDRTDFELILVDDGSTDGSSQKCDAFAQEDSRIVVIHQSNGGICKARNAALKIARGEYVGFSDHDDDFEQGVWEKCIDLIERYHRPDMIKFGKNYVFVDSSGKVYRKLKITHDNGFFGRDKIVKDYLKFRQQSLYRFVWDGIYKKSIIDENNILFDPFFTHGGEDHDFCNTFSRYIKNFVSAEDVYYNHYLRTGFSTSSKSNGKQYYLTEGKRLIDTLRFIGYDIDANKSLYWNEVFNSCVLPYLRDGIKQKQGRRKTIDAIVALNENCPILKMTQKVPLRALIKQSKKLGVFAYLYMKGFYNALYGLSYLRYKV